MTTIEAVRSAFPANRYPQAELTRKFAELSGIGRAQRALLERLHGNAGVDARHTALPLPDYDGLREIADTNDRYIDEATDLGEQALRAALDAAGLAGRDVDLLIVASVTGVTVPSLDARLIPRLGLRPDVKRLPIFGLGCVAGAAGLGRLHDYLLAVELCSLCFPTSHLTTADLVVSGLFGDGAAALVATGAQAAGAQAAGAQAAGAQAAGARAARLPRVIATRSEVYPGSGGTLGWRLDSGGFRIVLTADLADVVERRLSGSVGPFLAEHGLTARDIASWVCHPGGPRVIDAIQKSLQLPDSAVEMSRRSLAEAGNMSSVSVLHILEKTIDTCPPPGSAGLMIGLGPGVSAELVLLQW
jgi:alkylresorcinol/alkylpyrone synthase